MKPINTTLMLMLAGMFMLPSCKKYEDGPALSLRSKKARIANEWQIERVYEKGSDVTNDFDEYTLDLTKDNSATLTYTYRNAGFTIQLSTRGTWALVDDKENLRLDFDNNDSDGNFRILRLKEKELWLREMGGDTELHLMPR